MPGISNCRLRARRGCQSQKKKLRDNRSGVHAAAKAPAVRLSSLRVVARVPRTRMRSRRSIRKRGGEKGEGRDGMHDLPSACWARLAAARPDRREGILANVCASVTARCQVGYGASGSCAQAGCWAKSGLWRTMQRGRLDAATRLIGAWDVHVGRFSLPCAPAGHRSAMCLSTTCKASSSSRS